MILRGLAWASILFLLAGCTSEPAPKPIAEAPIDTAGLSAAIMAAVPQPLPPSQGPIYIMLRENGVARRAQWHSGRVWEELLPDVLAETFAAAKGHDIDGIELCLSYGYREADPVRDRGEFTNIHRGVRGLELSAPDRTERYSPTYMLATNRDFRKLIERFGDPKVTARVFEAHQLFVTRDEGVWKVHPMFRGNTVVTMRDVTEENVQRLARTMSDWLLRQVHENGRITYKYWPSSGEESNANNMIRQFMATVCLGRMAEFYEDPSIREAQNRNLAYNFGRFYRERNGLGYIEFDGKAKLGAAGLAALAVIEHPDPSPFAAQRDRLIALTRHLHHEDGSFRTFYIPPTRSDNQNFYPGEALLAWARLLETSEDRELLDAFMKSFAYYRQWHLDNRNPAFVPWHTQAYYLVWKKTQHPELAAFIFEMNDWLLGMQEWDESVYPDTQGRFYDAKRTHYGPPHASSTGVYLEGLIDAYALATALGETNRAGAYRRTICRGIRSLMQLQFADDVDMYYVSQRRYVEGGLRTTVYDNEIRVDNVQHGLMGLLKILEIFEQDDYEAAAK